MNRNDYSFSPGWAPTLKPSPSTSPEFASNQSIPSLFLFPHYEFIMTDLSWRNPWRIIDSKRFIRKMKRDNDGLQPSTHSSFRHVRWWFFRFTSRIRQMKSRFGLNACVPSHFIAITRTLTHTRIHTRTHTFFSCRSFQHLTVALSAIVIFKIPSEWHMFWIIYRFLFSPDFRVPHRNGSQIWNISECG